MQPQLPWLPRLPRFSTIPPAPGNDRHIGRSRKLLTLSKQAGTQRRGQRPGAGRDSCHRRCPWWPAAVLWTAWPWGGNVSWSLAQDMGGGRAGELGCFWVSVGGGGSPFCSPWSQPWFLRKALSTHFCALPSPRYSEPGPQAHPAPPLGPRSPPRSPTAQLHTGLGLTPARHRAPCWGLSPTHGAPNPRGLGGVSSTSATVEQAPRDLDGPGGNAPQATFWANQAPFLACGALSITQAAGALWWLQKDIAPC